MASWDSASKWNRKASINHGGRLVVYWPFGCDAGLVGPAVVVVVVVCEFELLMLFYLARNTT